MLKLCWIEGSTRSQLPEDGGGCCSLVDLEVGSEHKESVPFGCAGEETRERTILSQPVTCLESQPMTSKSSPRGIKFFEPRIDHALG